MIDLKSVDGFTRSLVRRQLLCGIHRTIISDNEILHEGNLPSEKFELCPKIATHLSLAVL